MTVLSCTIITTSQTTQPWNYLTFISRAASIPLLPYVILLSPLLDLMLEKHNKNRRNSGTDGYYYFIQLILNQCIQIEQIWVSWLRQTYKAKFAQSAFRTRTDGAALEDHCWDTLLLNCIYGKTKEIIHFSFLLGLGAVWEPCNYYVCLRQSKAMYSPTL